MSAVLSLLIGLVVGTLSSVFTATPLLLAITRRWPPGAGAGSQAGGAGPDRWAAADPYANVPPGR